MSCSREGRGKGPALKLGGGRDGTRGDLAGRDGIGRGEKTIYVFFLEVQIFGWCLNVDFRSAAELHLSPEPPMLFLERNCSDFNYRTVFLIKYKTLLCKTGYCSRGL